LFAQQTPEQQRGDGRPLPGELAEVRDLNSPISIGNALRAAPPHAAVQSHTQTEAEAQFQ
jgi:hypothetical protein